MALDYFNLVETFEFTIMPSSLGDLLDHLHALLLRLDVGGEVQASRSYVMKQF